MSAPNLTAPVQYWPGLTGDIVDNSVKNTFAWGTMVDGLNPVEYDGRWTEWARRMHHGNQDIFRFTNDDHKQICFRLFPFMWVK